ncbi:MAG: GDSL family lipase [Planctomycetes bacterium]|nr:GDSL family lipase [Planctomycetota bacterium]
MKRPLLAVAITWIALCVICFQVILSREAWLSLFGFGILGFLTSLISRAWLALPVWLIGFPFLLLTEIDSLARMRIVETLGMDHLHNSAIKPEPHDAAKHEVLRKRAAQGNADILFLGDSITVHWLEEGKSVWDSQFARMNAVAFGIGGNKTQHLLWRLRDDELNGLSPRVIVVLIGTNNLGVNTSKQIVAGVQANVSELRQRQPQARILLLGLLPRDERPTDPIRAKIKAVNTGFASLADGKNVFFEDIGDCLLESDGKLSAETSPDFLHLSTEGYRRFAKALRPLIEKLLKGP